MTEPSGPTTSLIPVAQPAPNDATSAPPAPTPFDDDADDLHHASSSTLAAAFNLGNCALGAGFLLIPQVFSRLGLGLATLVFCFCTLLMGFTLHILGVAATRTGQLSYQGAMRAAIGEKVALVML